MTNVLLSGGKGGRFLSLSQRKKQRNRPSRFVSCVLIRKPVQRCRTDCRLMDLSAKRAENALWRGIDNEGYAAAAATPPARFSRRKNGASPAGDTTQYCSRPITHRVIARIKCAEKEPERRYASLLAISEFPTLFHTACRKPSNQRLVFGERNPPPPFGRYRRMKFQ